MKNNWISVKDRLPETHTDVLIYDEISGYILIGAWSIKSNFWYSNDSRIKNVTHLIVTHWMPLPEPPKQ